MLKTMALFVLAGPTCIRTDKNELGIDGGGGISSSKINDKITIQQNSIKKMSFKVGFCISKTSLAFTKLKKVFTKALILHYFNLEPHIQIETDASSNAISRMLCQLTIKKGLMGQVIYKTNNQMINSPSEIS